MIFEPTKTFNRLLDAYVTGSYRLYMLQGGTSSSKTYSIMQLLVYIAIHSTTPRLIVVMAESVPAFKDGARKDLFDILQTNEGDDRYNNTDHKFKIGKCVIQFRSADKSMKQKGKRQDILYLNECNNYPKSVFDQTEPRTKECVFMDWNPDVKFYAHGMTDEEDVYFDISTHWDNHHLDPRIRRSIEARKDTDPEWYRVYGKGEIGQYEGLVFRNWKYCDLSKVYNQFDELHYGLDFGYSPDPAVFTICAKKGNNIYVLKEMVFQEFTNQQLAEAIKPYVNDNVLFCDSAEPKSIAELKTHGILSKGVKKGKDSRKFRINWLKGHKIWVHKTCNNLKSELEVFSRLKDKNGDILPMFMDGKDHSIDAVCYAFNAIMFQTGMVSKSIGI